MLIFFFKFFFFFFLFFVGVCGGGCNKNAGCRATADRFINLKEKKMRFFFTHIENNFISDLFIYLIEKGENGNQSSIPSANSNLVSYILKFHGICESRNISRNIFFSPLIFFQDGVISTFRTTHERSTVATHRLIELV